jgi:hypothetical protein
MRTAAIRCWPYAVQSITGPSSKYLRGSNIRKQIRKNHLMLPRTRSRDATTDSATERVTRSASFVTCLWPRWSPLCNSLIVTSTPQRHASILRMVPARLREIGHDELHAFRPLVTPFLREYERDITQIMPRRTANKDPVIVAAAVRFGAGAPRITTLGQMLDQSTPMSAIRQLPCPGHCKDGCLLVLGEQAQGLMRSTTGISHHHDLLHPGWRDNGLQPLPQQAMLVPATLGIDAAHSHRDAQTLPTRHQQHPREAKLIRVLLPVAGEVAQGMLTPPLRLARTVAKQIQHTVGGRWQRPQGDSGPICYRGVSVPWPRPDHPHAGPRGQRRRAGRA